MITQIFLTCVWIFLKPFNLLIWFESSHINASLYAFDTIIDAPPNVELHNLAQYQAERARASERQIRRFFILPICVWAYLVVHSVWVMWNNDFEYYARPIPDLFTRRIYLKEFRQQGDMLGLVVTTAFALYGFTFTFGSLVSDKYCMYVVYDPSGEYDLIGNGKVWNKENAEKIYKSTTHQNFSQCCFRLVNGYRLDSTAFNMAIFIMSTFFQYICRQNHKHF